MGDKDEAESESCVQLITSLSPFSSLDYSNISEHGIFPLLMRCDVREENECCRFFPFPDSKTDCGKIYPLFICTKKSRDVFDPLCTFVEYKCVCVSPAPSRRERGHICRYTSLKTFQTHSHFHFGHFLAIS